MIAVNDTQTPSLLHQEPGLAIVPYIVLLIGSIQLNTLSCDISVRRHHSQGSVYAVEIMTGEAIRG